MNTLLSQLKSGIRNVVIAIATLVCVLPGSTLFAQQTMSLGDLRFVLPDANATLASRTLRMNMSASRITSQDLSLVGGIAFTQTAIPDLKIGTASIYYSQTDSTAHIILDGQDIIVPLDLFELQPIVSFANSNNNVMITRYGQRYGAIHQRTQSAEILYHPAFVDNISGLRLLQVDVIGELGYKNYDFPAIDGKPLLTPSEKTHFHEPGLYDSFDMARSYSAAVTISGYLYKYFGDSGFTFIYTDIKEPIHFKIVDDEIVFSGFPYFLFGTIVKDKVDKFSFYSYYKSYCIHVVKEIDKTQNPAILDRAWKREFEEGFLRIDAQQDKTLGQKATELLKGMYDKESPVYQAFAEQFSILRGGFRPGWSFGTDKLPQMFPLYQEVPDATEELRDNPDVIRNLNPLVYKEVDNMCHWAALFRYLKAKSPSSWKKFASAVKKQTLPPPSVKTPVGMVTQVRASHNSSLPPEIEENMRTFIRNYVDSLKTDLIFKDLLKDSLDKR